MNILGIDTSTDICSVGLAGHEGLISEYLLRQGYIHAERLPEAVSFVLHAASTGFKHIDAIAVTSGPGSFTGLRIGIAFAKGLAAGQNIPLIKIPTMDCFIYSVPMLALYACVLVRARKGEFYYQRYIQKFNGWTPDSKTQIYREDDLLPMLEQYRDSIVSGNLTREMKIKIQRSAPEVKIIDPISLRCFGSAAALMGVERFKKGETILPEDLAPIYLSKFLGAG